GYSIDPAPQQAVGSTVSGSAGVADGSATCAVGPGAASPRIPAVPAMPATPSTQTRASETPTGIHARVMPRIRPPDHRNQTARRAGFSTEWNDAIDRASVRTTAAR